MIKKIIVSIIFLLLIVLTGCSSNDRAYFFERGSVEGYVTYTSNVDYVDSAIKADETKMQIKVLPSRLDVQPMNLYSYLSDVEIHVEGTNKFAYTNVDGYFRIDGLNPGRNILVFAHPNFKTFKIGVDIFSGQIRQVNGANLPLIHYLLIGINDYYGDKNDLPGSINSLNYFWNNIGLNSSFNSCGLKFEDEAATKDNIREAIRTIGNNMEPNDYFVFYYAGHGAEDYFDGSKEYICNYVEGKIGGPNDWISDDDLEDWFAQDIPNNKITVILDSCYSGGFITDTQSLNLFTTDSGQKAQLSSLNVFATEINKNGYTVITAADHDETGWQYSLISDESNAIALLTNFLIEGVLQGENYPADWNRDKEVTARELFNYAEPRIIEFQQNNGFKKIAHPQIWEGNVDPVIFRYQ